MQNHKSGFSQQTENLMCTIFERGLTAFRNWTDNVRNDAPMVEMLRRLNADVLLSLQRRDDGSTPLFITTRDLQEAAHTLRRFILSESPLTHTILSHYPACSNAPARFQFAQDLLQVAQIAEQLEQCGIEKFSLMAA